MLCTVCFFMLAPKADAYAQQDYNPGDEVIYIDGEPYYLCNVIYGAQPLAVDPSSASYFKEQISYAYVDTTGRTLVVVADIIGYASVGNTVLARARQTTKWNYVYEESVEFVSASTDFSYVLSGAFVFSPTQRVSYDASGNGTYTYEYLIFYGDQHISAEISTTCSIYGEIS